MRSGIRLRWLRTTFGLIPVVLAGLGVVASVFFWGPALASAQSGTVSSADLGLFAVAGVLGAALRSIAYLLASASFSERQERQWRIEAVTSPILGAVAGIAAYLVVLSSIVRIGGINPPGQYLLSLLAGASALAIFGRVAERGLLRSGTNRSGILGGEVSSSVPMLQRIDALLEQRVADLTIVDYDGHVLVSSYALSSTHWAVTVRFLTDLEGIGKIPPMSEMRPVSVQGGTKQETVPFLLSVTSERTHAVPSQLTASVPRSGLSRPLTLVVELLDPSLELPLGGLFVVVQIGQGSQVLQAVPIRLEVP